MTTTTKLGLELLANNAANQVLSNTTFAQLNQLVQAGAVDRTNTPPGSPANEALYIITATATGAWAGKENQLAYWLTSASAWTYIVPREGFLIHVNDEDLFYKYDGSAWASFSGGGMTNPMTTAGDIIIGGSSGTPTRLAAGTDGYVLTLASGSPTWAAPSGGGGATLPVVQALSSTRNLVLADINTFNVNSTGTNYTVTIQPQSAETWTADAEIHFLPSSTGNIVITGGAGVSLNGVVAGSITLSTAFGAASIKRIAPDSWWLGGVAGQVGASGDWAAAGGVANTYTLTPVVARESYVIGDQFRTRFSVTNTGATTVNVSGLGTKTCVTVTGAALPAGYIRTDADTVLSYDGTNFVVDRLVERGSNENGTFIRRADGTLKCSRTGTAQNATSASGSMFVTSPQATWTFPAAYSAKPWTGYAPEEGVRFGIIFPTSTTAATYRQARFVSSAITEVGELSAEGFWY